VSNFNYSIFKFQTHKHIVASLYLQGTPNPTARHGHPLTRSYC